MDSAQDHRPMDADDLRQADEEILDVLADGRATKGMLVDQTDYSRNTVYNRLEVLEAAEHIAAVHEGTRLFELVDDPREDGVGDPDDPGITPSDVEALRSERDRLRHDLSACRDDLQAARETSDADAQAALAALDDLEAALERGERQTAESALERARDAFGEGT